MKFNIDMSSSEFSGLLGSLKEDARTIASYEARDIANREALYQAQTATRTAERGKQEAERNVEYWKSEHEYQREMRTTLATTVDQMHAELEAFKRDGSNTVLFRKMLEAALLAQAGKKIHAIKVIRSALNLSLKDAKDMVEGATQTFHTAASKESLAALEAAHANPPDNTLGDLLRKNCGGS